eukprot:CAMPEP_0198255380 /NCGR_PEP_ID=MMETSP1447-20131203/5513_1 /TAXON_ID=420782 /ORGANISM="Chaetoceros dichaeta, Strain CCMP1751" /LENGTH=48 /DNA_ID= /DNA_START= /DNA_END= /DNA_ORIENTATION=
MASPTKSYLEALQDVIFNPMSTRNRRRLSATMGRSAQTTLRSNNGAKS